MTQAPTQKPWSVNVITLFPDMFPGPMAHSLVGKALTKGLWRLTTTPVRDFACYKPSGIHHTVDDTPYGGGPGMVIRADVVGRAVDTLLERTAPHTPELVYLTPRGRPFCQKMAHEMTTWPSVAFLCGRYEGVDERVLQVYPWHFISVGDFILSGGETALFPILDACVRLLPGVLGHQESWHDESFSDGLLEYPHYTRPEIWRDLSVPPLLLSGHHGHIEKWRHQQSQELTQTLRPDLWKQYLKKNTKNARKKV